MGDGYSLEQIHEVLDTREELGTLDEPPSLTTICRFHKAFPVFPLKSAPLSDILWEIQAELKTHYMDTAVRNLIARANEIGTQEVYSALDFMTGKMGSLQTRRREIHGPGKRPRPRPRGITGDMEFQIAKGIIGVSRDDPRWLDGETMLELEHSCGSDDYTEESHP
jgi:hypothetical protein